MSEQKLVSPLLDGFVMGDPMSSHDGVCCCPAMKENSDDKYIVKIISVPASQKQLDALLLTGAYKDAAAAMEYFKELSDGVVKEAELLQQLAKLEGFLPYQNWQVVPMDDNKLGYQIYLVGSYKLSLEKFLRRNAMTHLGAVNLGLDLCAALAICRRAGYMYVDLKPTNVFLIGEREYRIGDLGFVSLKSLKYTSLPSKYRSCYTPPELHDALATLNATADTYAVGLILYQIYNNGQLPFQDHAPAGELPAPMNADYEMAEIILKACAPDPRNRWQNPIEMGQALVGYMQRNIVNDTPIVPPTVQTPAPAAAEPEDGEEDLLAGNPAAAPAEEATVQPPFMADMAADETLPGADEDDDLDDAEMSDEVSSMLAQADELLSHETPDPVTVRESTAPDDSADEEDEDENEDEDEFVFGTANSEDEEKDEDEEDSYDEADAGKRKKHPWVTVLIIIALLAVLGVGGYYFYQNYYLMNIEDMKLDGSENTLTVSLVTDIDESMLTVVCTDTYGNTKSMPVTDGQAVFTDLTPDTIYKVTVEVEGFHKLSGTTSDSYATPEQTNIVSFSAITGTEDGSVILNFTVDGADTQDWIVSYTAEGEEEKSVSFTGHMVTINGLTVGKTYTFTLAPAAELYVVGTDTLEFTASKLIVAENLAIVSCSDGVLTAEWNVPGDVSVESWSVRCYSDGGYDETTTVTEPTVQFSGVSSETAYTIEVVAAGMTQGARAYVSANPTTVSNIQVERSDSGMMTVTWEHSGSDPDGGWLLMYSIDGNDAPEVVKCTENLGVIATTVPNSVYVLSIQAADGSTVFGGKLEYTCPEAEEFNDYSLSASKIEASLCPTPEKEDWTYKDIAEDGYSSTFAVGGKASLVLYATKKISTSSDHIEVMYVFRDAEGNVLSDLINTESLVWKSMWSNRYAALNIPAIPAAAGSYTLEVYFNGALAVTKPITITE